MTTDWRKLFTANQARIDGVLLLRNKLNDLANGEGKGLVSAAEVRDLLDKVLMGPPS